MSHSVSNNESKVSLEDILKKLPSRFQSEQAVDMDVIFQFKLNDSISFYIKVFDQQCAIEKAEHDDPNITLLMDQATFIDLMLGNIDGMSAFMKGQLKAHGNVMLATSLGKLFKKRSGDNKKIQI